MHERLKLERSEHRGIFRKIKLRQIFAAKVKTDRLRDISGQLIQCLALGHNRKIQALGDVLLVALENADLYDPFHDLSLGCAPSQAPARCRLYRNPLRTPAEPPGSDTLMERSSPAIGAGRTYSKRGFLPCVS